MLLFGLLVWERANQFASYRLASANLLGITFVCLLSYSVVKEPTLRRKGGHSADPLRPCQAKCFRRGELIPVDPDTGNSRALLELERTTGCCLTAGDADCTSPPRCRQLQTPGTVLTDHSRLIFHPAPGLPCHRPMPQRPDPVLGSSTTARHRLLFQDSHCTTCCARTSYLPF